MIEQNNYKVYMHVFPNGKRYIGLTKQALESRWGINGVHYKKQPVYKAICEFGWENIKHVLIADSLSGQEAYDLEIELIKQYDSINNGYNVDTGGGMGSTPWETFTYNGIEYTASELADLSPIEDMTSHDITNRINSHGWSVEDAINKPLIHKNNLFDYNGDKYTSSELAKMSNVEELTAANINLRIRKHGWSVERAITQPKNVKKQPKGVGNRVYEYNGIYYNSYELCQISLIEDLKPSDITLRINKHGWSVERAITQPKKKNVIYYIMVNIIHLKKLQL